MREQTVLVVEDEQETLWTVEKVMEKVGYTTLSARTGADGIQKAVKYRPNAILLDVRLPDMTGFEVCKALKSRPETSDINIILVTGLDRAEVMSQAPKVGANFYIPKPFFPDDLAVDLYFMFDKEFYFTEGDRHLLRLARVVPPPQPPGMETPVEDEHDDLDGGDEVEESGTPDEDALRHAEVLARHMEAENGGNSSREEEVVEIKPAGGRRKSARVETGADRRDRFADSMLHEVQVIKRSIDVMTNRLSAIEKQLERYLARRF